MARRFKCLIEYDGTHYHGWQYQDDVPTIQGELNKAIKLFCNQEATIFTAGRTDAGVHATGQVMHVDLETELTEFKVLSAFNHFLKDKGIAVLDVNEVGDEFHARHCAKKRYYEYKIVNRRPPLAINAMRAYHFPADLNVDAMQEAANILIGNHDFSSFRDSQCQAKSPIKTLDKLDLSRNGDDIIIDVEAQSFLHHMVRILVGTLVQVGVGRWGPEKMHEILDAKNRCAGGPTAPAHGLYFTKVDY